MRRSEGRVYIIPRLYGSLPTQDYIQERKNLPALSLSTMAAQPAIYHENPHPQAHADAKIRNFTGSPFHAGFELNPFFQCACGCGYPHELEWTGEQGNYASAGCMYLMTDVPRQSPRPLFFSQSEEEQALALGGAEEAVEEGEECEAREGDSSWSAPGLSE